MEHADRLMSFCVIFISVGEPTYLRAKFSNNTRITSGVPGWSFLALPLRAALALRTHEAGAVGQHPPINRVMHKGKSRDRIDLAATLWMALSRASTGITTGSIYATRERPDGLLFV